MPALLTSMVMVGSVRSTCSTRATSAGSFRSAAITSTGLFGEARRQCVQPRSGARDEDQVVASARQPFGVDSADAGGGAGDQRRAHGVDGLTHLWFSLSS